MQRRMKDRHEEVLGRGRLSGRNAARAEPGL